MVIDRYIKQRIFLGIEADSLLRTKRVVIIGLGATGSVVASWLARSGIGFLTLIDRDVIELSNIHRQILFNESDIGQFKALVAASRLKEANSQIVIRAHTSDVTNGNINELLFGYDLIIDGTDNFETRFLINDYAIITKIPWIYSGVIGGEGIVWPIIIPQTPCLRCVIEEPPETGSVGTCSSVGVIGPSVGIIGSWAAIEAIKILVGKGSEKDIIRFNFWESERLFLKPPVSRCRFCSTGITEFLDKKWTLTVSSLCGLKGVHIRVNNFYQLQLERIAIRLERYTKQPWKSTPLTLSGRYNDLEIIIFKDGRVIIHGDVTIEYARSWYAEFIGY